MVQEKGWREGPFVLWTGMSSQKSDFPLVKILWHILVITLSDENIYLTIIIFIYGAKIFCRPIRDTTNRKCLPQNECSSGEVLEMGGCNRGGWKSWLEWSAWVLVDGDASTDVEWGIIAECCVDYYRSWIYLVWVTVWPLVRKIISQKDQSQVKPQDKRAWGLERIRWWGRKRQQQI